MMMREREKFLELSDLVEWRTGKKVERSEEVRFFFFFPSSSVQRFRLHVGLALELPHPCFLFQTRVPKEKT